MDYQLQFLSGIDISIIYEAFMAAFSDYAQDSSQVTEASFTNRATKNGVDLGSSVGVFHQGRLVGFTLVGLDTFEGRSAAFDAGTGILKPFRGQGLAKAMFDFAIPTLQTQGVKRFYLEALQENEAAVRAYRKAGFDITRELDSYGRQQLDAPDTPADGYRLEIRPISRLQLAAAAAFFDWQPSWENSLSSLNRIPGEILCLGAFKGSKLAGILVHHPNSNWIMSLAVHPSFRRQKIGTALLARLKAATGDRYHKALVINVDHGDAGMARFLETSGFRLVFNQFEMALDLSGCN